jgi:uncharacterized membrane protein
MESPRVFTSAEALRFGWNITKGNLKPLLAIGFLAAFLALLQRALQAHPDGLRMLMSFVVQLAQVAVALIWIRAALRLHDGKPLATHDLLDGLDGYFTFLLTAVLYGLIVAGGMILLIVPGVIWAIKYGFATFVTVDQHLDPLAAVRESGRITEGQKGHLFAFGLALIGVNLLGALALGVGLLVTIPTTYLAAAYVYRRLEAHAGATVSVAPGPALPV